MPSPTPNLDIVTLLLDSDFKRRPDTGTWSHDDGRPFTKEEQQLAFQATRVEMEAVQQQLKRQADYRREQQEATDSLMDLVARYGPPLIPDNTPFANAVPLMTDEDRAEYERVCEILAPDGWLYAPNED